MTQPAAPAPDAFDWVKIGWAFLGAAIATGVGYIGHLFERRSAIRTDNINKRFDDLCNEIDRLSGLAAAYWTIEGDADADSLKVAALDVKSSLHRVRSIVGYLESDVPGLLELIEPRLERLSDQATGDTFEVHDRPSQRHRTYHVKTAANDLVLASRDGQRKHFDLWLWKGRVE